jgi:hypothetical protein
MKYGAAYTVVLYSCSRVNYKHTNFFQRAPFPLLKFVYVKQCILHTHYTQNAPWEQEQTASIPGQ